jgi:hypothetical protein
LASNLWGSVATPSFSSFCLAAFIVSCMHLMA